MNSELPSNRSFGWVFAGVFLLAGTLSLWRGGTAYPWMLGLACVLATIVSVRPDWLAPLNRAWMKVGEVLHRTVSPIVLGLIFFGIFTPVAALMRIAGRDALRRSFEPDAASYWIERHPPGPVAENFPDEF
jgi:hypothetical protein